MHPNSLASYGMESVSQYKLQLQVDGEKGPREDLIPGRPVGDITEMHSMNVRNVPKDKRAHGLSKSITHGAQNAGKW